MFSIFHALKANKPVEPWLISAWTQSRRYLVACFIALVVPIAQAVDITIGTIDAGASLTVNGTPATASDVLTFAEGDTVTFLTSFGGQTYEDVIEAHYDIEVQVHAVDYATHPGDNIYLDTDLGYTPYDIFVITSTDDTEEFDFEMETSPTDDPVQIIGFHVMVPEAEIEELGSTSHSGTPSDIAEIFYGTVESNGFLDIDVNCGSAFNKIVADDVEFESGCSDETDIMIQELYADYAESDDTEISWWRMELTDQFYVGDDYEGGSLNDELPELASLNDDPMLWFKARNPSKWSLWPLIKIDGMGSSWEFDNYYYEDYNFWEMHLGGDFYWYNDDYDTEYAHFLGPVMEMDRFTWTPYDEMYINFFGDNNSNYYYNDRFNGDYGSAGTDFWNPLLTSDYGYTKDGNNNIVSPLFVFKLREGYFEAGYNETNLYLADNQDILLLSDTSEIEFHEANEEIFFHQGSNSHWVVEDRLTYTGEVPTDDAFNLTPIFFDKTGDALAVAASNNYKSGDDNDSTMYVAYRKQGEYGKQLTKLPMSYSAGVWSVSATLPDAGDYNIYIVATENDGIYGKVIEASNVGIKIFNHGDDGNTLTHTGNTIHFKWNSDYSNASPTDHYLWIGSSQGGSDLANTGTLGTDTQIDITGIPLDGSTIWTRLWWQYDGVWQYTDQFFTAPTVNLASVDSPVDGATISGDTVDFSLSSDDATSLWLWVGSDVAHFNYFNSGLLSDWSSPITVTGLPADDSTVYVRLWFYMDGEWQYLDSSYTSVPGGFD